MRRSAMATLTALALVGVVAVLGPQAALSAATGDKQPPGTCLAAPALPCTASAGQVYGGLKLGGGHRRESVEAVLTHVIGAGASVELLATVGGDDDDDDDRDDDEGKGNRDAVVKPLRGKGARGIEWSYRGEAQTLAYITVKAGDRFALVGVAGSSEGTVDLSGLLGRREISSVRFWAAVTSLTRPVAASVVHGDPDEMPGNTRLALVEDGTVPCVHVETAEPARCIFDPPTPEEIEEDGAEPVRWIETASGDAYAAVGQSAGVTGADPDEPEYVIAAEIAPDGTVPALEPTGNDSAGLTSDMELLETCSIEIQGSNDNASGEPLVNHADNEVPTSSNPHPDGAQLVRSENGIHYYTGPGAALNDRNGTERDAFGIYLRGPSYCHRIWSGGFEVPGAKRPATAYGRILPRTPILWRPVAPGVLIANGVT